MDRGRGGAWDQLPALRRIREGYEKWGYEALFDKRVGKASPRRIAVEVIEQVLSLYRERYFDLNVKHYHEKLQEEHQVEVSYTWVKGLLQGAGLVAKDSVRKKHRRKRERYPKGADHLAATIGGTCRASSY